MAKKAPAGAGNITKYKTAQGKTLWRVVYRYRDPATGASRQTTKRGFTSQEEARRFLTKVTGAVDAGAYIAPAKLTVGEWMTTFVAGLRIKPSTRSSYKNKVRLYIEPNIGDIRLQKLSGADLDGLYRKLETQGRQVAKGQAPAGLSMRTVLYVHQILASALKEAVRQGLLAANPADRATPPSAKEAKAPQMVTWSADEVRRFVEYEFASDYQLAPAWHLFATTGLRRGELLGLRWQDVDLDNARVVVRQQIGVDDKRRTVVVPSTKTGKTRVVDIDAATADVLKSHRKRQAEERLSLGPKWRDHGLVFAIGRQRTYGEDSRPGDPLHPERFTRTFQSRIDRYNETAELRKVEQLPVINIHGLRHTHATLALAAGIHPKVVQERLGHATIAITLDIYSHVAPTMQQEAAERVANLIGL